MRVSDGCWCVSGCWARLRRWRGAGLGSAGEAVVGARQFLADDKLEGRDTGSAGFEKAAAYVTEQFERLD